ncbi:hypothetical protein B0H16DRAFT_1482114 [Mycena metata]|uniref:Secreted protein n=1 Tax=Mycena metata TaxID=1033252 RepID=A0AAD7GUT9_9AGAR|nr:hypothetical protein B0H16DRAFT_1482114 [Mycena metata]
MGHHVLLCSLTILGSLLNMLQLLRWEQQAEDRDTAVASFSGNRSPRERDGRLKRQQTIFFDFFTPCHDNFKATSLVVTVTRQKKGNATGGSVTVTVAPLQMQEEGHMLPKWPYLKCFGKIVLPEWKTDSRAL